MSDIVIPLTPLTVPPATCLPATTQELIDLCAQCLEVALPDGYTQIVVGSNTPAPEDQGKIWLKLDGSGNPIAFYKYAGGAWVPVAPQMVFWAVDGGTVNALSIGVTNYPNAALSSGLFIVQASNTNTGATTLAVNAFPAKPVKLAGADPYAGAILEDHWYILSYNPGSSTFELLNPSPEVKNPTLVGIWCYQIASGTAAGIIPAGDNTIPLNTTVTAAAFGTLGGNAVALGEGQYLIQASIYVRDSSGPSSGGVQLAIKNGGADVNWQDGFISNIDEGAQLTAMGAVTVTSGGSASITIQLRINTGDELTYGVCPTSARAERPAVLVIQKLA